VDWALFANGVVFENFSWIEPRTDPLLATLQESHSVIIFPLQEANTIFVRHTSSGGMVFRLGGAPLFGAGQAESFLPSTASELCERQLALSRVDVAVEVGYGAAPETPSRGIFLERQHVLR